LDTEYNGFVAKLILCLLGSLQVTLDEQPVTQFGTDKTRALLGYLAIESDRPHRRESLAGLLWPEQPNEAARHSLRQALVRLRTAIGDTAVSPFLLITSDTIQFNHISDHWLDVAEFSTLTHTCQSHSHRQIEECESCIVRLRQAVDLYHGDLLQQLFLGDSTPFEEWMLVKRESLHIRALETLTTLTTYHERRGEYVQARRYAARQIELEPWREEAYQQMMRTYALGGNRNAALLQYEQCRRILAKEFATEPSEETVALYEQIRDERLARPPAPTKRSAQVFEEDVATTIERLLPTEANADPLSVRQTLVLKASVYLKHDDFVQAIACQKQALELCETIGDKAETAAMQLRISDTLQQQGELEQAAIHAQHALALSQQIGDQPHIAAALHIIGEIFFIKGEENQACESLERALKIQRTLANPSAELRLLTRLSTIYHHRADDTCAVDYLQRALEIQTRLGNSVAIAAIQREIENYPPR
jgi:DNA-binding SARP family transcriptional activator